MEQKVYVSLSTALALKSLGSGQITLSTLLIKPNIRFHSPTANAATQFLYKLTPLSPLSQVIRT